MIILNFQKMQLVYIYYCDSCCCTGGLWRSPGVFSPFLPLTSCIPNPASVITRARDIDRFWLLGALGIGLAREAQIG